MVKKGQTFQCYTEEFRKKRFSAIKREKKAIGVLRLILVFGLLCN